MSINRLPEVLWGLSSEWLDGESTDAFSYTCTVALKIIEKMSRIKTAQFKNEIERVKNEIERDSSNQAITTLLSNNKFLNLPTFRIKEILKCLGPGQFHEAVRKFPPFFTSRHRKAIPPPLERRILERCRFQFITSVFFSQKEVSFLMESRTSYQGSDRQTIDFRLEIIFENCWFLHRTDNDREAIFSTTTGSITLDDAALKIIDRILRRKKITKLTIKDCIVENLAFPFSQCTVDYETSPIVDEVPPNNEDDRAIILLVIISILTTVLVFGILYVLRDFSGNQWTGIKVSFTITTSIPFIYVYFNYFCNKKPPNQFDFNP